ncbi:MAG: carbohydrate ABC transporter permease [Anaerolineae bacterium]|nr:carbohydrate ABC transporter permease [Anaerolineae bacterium]MDW8070155.1 carbohydrate ABC transporter permease [Anaerolineae bacterium]
MYMTMRQTRRIKLGITYFFLAIWTVICLFPIYWLVITSVKLPVAVFQGPTYFPWIDFQPTLNAWKYVLAGPMQNQVIRSWLNSAIMAPTSAALAVAIGSLAGYALTRFNYYVPVLKWRNNDIAFWIISQRMLPPVVVILPYLIMYRVLGLVDTHAGMILIYTVFNLPFAVWIMRDFFANLPRDLEESALIDGASRLQAFRLIVLPLSSPGLIATFLFCMMFSWNDYLFALMLTFSRATTMPMFVAGVGSQSYGPQWWLLSALSLLTIAPMIVIALLIERYITRGLIVGAIK